MPAVTFQPGEKTVRVKEGTSLFDAAHLAGLPVASSCGAEAICGKCNMTVLSGLQGLSAPKPIEEILLKKEGKPPTDRISCQTRVVGDCVVTTTYW